MDYTNVDMCPFVSSSEAWKRNAAALYPGVNIFLTNENPSPKFLRTYFKIKWPKWTGLTVCLRPQNQLCQGLNRGKNFLKLQLFPPDCLGPQNYFLWFWNCFQKKTYSLGLVMVAQQNRIVVWFKSNKGGGT